MSKKAYPSQTQDRFIVRLPDGMRDWLSEQAKNNGRSMNSEIVSRLEATMIGDKARQQKEDEMPGFSDMIAAASAKAAVEAVDEVLKKHGIFDLIKERKNQAE